MKGFTLLEVMISMLIFTLVVASMSPAFLAQVRANTRSEVRTEAIAAAEQVLDSLRVQEPRSLPSTGAGGTSSITVGDRVYSVVPYYCEQSTYCNTVNNRHITVRVTYRNEQVFETQTVFTQLR